MRSKLWVLAVTAALVACVGRTATAGAVAPVWSPTELTATDAAAHDGFGTAVAISGKSAIVSAPLHAPGGAAYVFGLGPSGWAQQAEFHSPVASPYVNYGKSVAIDGNLAAVGAVTSQSAAAAQGAYVYARSGGVWRERAFLHNHGPLDGWSVAISGDTIVVGAPQLRNLRNGPSGSVFVYQQTGHHWSLQATLTDATEPPDYGTEVAIDGDTIVVGAPHFSGGPRGAGSAYVYRRAGRTWTADGTLQATAPQTGDLFGGSVAVSHGTLMVGASNFGNPEQAGSAYLFTDSGSGWTLRNTISDGKPYSYFGSTVAISGNRALVGLNPGSGSSDAVVQLFRLNAGFVESNPQLAPTGASAGDELGAALAISGKQAIVGAYNTTVAGQPGAGAAYVFTPS